MLKRYYILMICITNAVCGPALPITSLIESDSVLGKETAVVDIGTTPGYVKAAYYLLDAINETADPCQDFFEYACGRWISQHPIPHDLGTYGVFAAIREKVALEMKELYESKEPTHSKAMDGVKTLFQACMDTDRQRSLHGREIVEAMKHLGNWPVVYGDQWNEESFDFTEMMVRIVQTRTVDLLMDIYVSPDQKNVSRRLIHIDQGSLGLGSGAREYYLNEKKYASQLEAYKKYIIAKVMLVSHDAGIVRKPSEVEEEVDAIIDFEKKLAKILIPEQDRRNFTNMYHLHRLSTLSDFLSEMNWDKYFRLVMPRELHFYLDKDPLVNVNEENFLKQLDQLLKATPNRTLANYMIWRYTSAWSFQLDERYDDIQQEFLKVIIGKQVKSPRWKDCSHAAVGRMNHASGALYIKSYFDKADKEVALEMVNHLRDAFKEMLKEDEWLLESTRERALHKTDAMLSLIGYPDFIRSIRRLDHYYRLLDINPNDTYAETVTKTSRWSLEHSYRKLVKPVERSEFGASSSTVNAFYSSLKNAIVFPAAILQAPLFDRSFPKAINFGGIGSVIGHEMTHGFDDEGSQFDYNGNLREWWDPKTENNFKEKKKCFVKEYGNYVVPGTDTHINGLLTQGENIADNGGVKEAFRAYRNYVKKLGHEEKRLPGLEHLDMNQIFFLSYAQTWCGHSRPAALIRQALTDQHSPLRNRVNGVVVNQPEFAKAFKCPLKSPMNPAEKCTLW